MGFGLSQLLHDLRRMVASQQRSAPSSRCVATPSRVTLEGWTYAAGADRYRGYYRTWVGAYRGEILHASSSVPDFYILNPPTKLLSGPHGLCFLQKNRGRFWIHWNTPPDSLDSGIVRVEHSIMEAIE